jgi:hypothetical protein
MGVITTKQANGSFAAQVFDEVVGSARKWFTLAGNLLDGTFHPIPADGSEQVGFIGAYLPDVGGNIQRPALNLDGIDDYTDFPYASILQPDSITIELKIMLTANPDTDDNNNWRWLLNPRGWTAPCFLILEQNRTINFTVRVGDTDYRSIGGAFSGEQIAVGEIAWLTYAYDSVTGHGYAYKNGALSRSGVMKSGGGALDKSSNGWRFSWPSGTSAPPEGHGCFPGVLLELRIWNYVRSQAEIQRDMNKPLKGDESGLIGYWTLDEGSGNVVYDKTVNANHGTIYGATWTQVPGASVVRWKLDTPRSAHKLRVHGDTQRNTYPVDFDIQLYDANANKLLERQVRGNTQVQWSEVLSQTYDFTVMDVTVYKMSAASPVVLTEASNEFSIVRKDTLLPKVADAKLSVGIGIWSADTLLSKLVDSKAATTVSFAKADTLLPKVADSSFFRQYQFRRTDTLLPKTQEVSVPVVSKFTKTDILLSKLNEVKDITVRFTKADTVLLSSRVEDGQITVNLTRPDTLLPVLAELSTPTNVHTKMDEDARTIYGKVEIVYTNPFMDSDMVITTPPTGRYTYPEQITDNIVQPQYKWFSLHDNKLDGSYHPMPGNKEYSVGWWGTELSDAEGRFATPVVIAAEFQQPRLLYELMVAGDSLLENYPVDFSIQLYDSNNLLLYEEVVTNNNQAVWHKDIPDVQNVKKIVLTITRISKPNQVAKITEFFTNVVETYEGDKIESIHLLEELEFPSASVTLGSVSSNEIDITLDNTDGRFNLGNTASPLNGLLKQNRRVRAWLGVEIVPGEIEWHPLGVFWTVLWRVPDQSVWVYTTARDRLELLRQTDFVTSTVYENYSLYQLFELVLRDAGLRVDEYYIDPSLQSIIIPYAWFDRMSHRDALQQLAGMAIVQVYCDREYGKVIVERTQPTPTVIYTFDDDKNLFDKDFPLVWNQIANYIEVVATQWAPGAASTVLDCNEVVEILAGQEVELTYGFSSVPVVNVQAPTIVADPDIQLVSYTSYAWGVTLKLRNNGTGTERVTQITVQGQPLEQRSSVVAVAKDDLLIKETGKIKATIQHDFIQTRAYAQQLADDLLNLCKNARYDIVMNTRGNIALKLGHRVVAPGHLQNVTYEYMVKRQEINWAGSLEATVEGQKV